MKRPSEWHLSSTLDALHVRNQARSYATGFSQSPIFTGAGAEGALAQALGQNQSSKDKEEPTDDKEQEVDEEPPHDADDTPDSSSDHNDDSGPAAVSLAVGVAA